MFIQERKWCYAAIERAAITNVRFANNLTICGISRSLISRRLFWRWVRHYIFLQFARVVRQERKNCQTNKQLKNKKNGFVRASNTGNGVTIVRSLNNDPLRIGAVPQGVKLLFGVFIKRRPFCTSYTAISLNVVRWKHKHTRQDRRVIWDF